MAWGRIVRLLHLVPPLPATTEEPPLCDLELAATIREAGRVRQRADVLLSRHDPPGILESALFPPQPHVPRAPQKERSRK